jgi:two-component system, NtrC family, sensor histidine kinase KinB
MRFRNLQSRFIFAGGLLIAATIGASAWSALTFARLNAVVDETLRDSEETIDRTAELASSLEREDDALLLFVSGDVAKARADLAAERHRGDTSFTRLLASLREDAAEERTIAGALREQIERYRAAGDELLATGTRPGALERYHRQVNPLLRQAAAACDKLREANFRAMRNAGVRARDESARGTRVVAAIAVSAVLIGAAIAIWLARSVLHPVRELTDSVEEVRRGNFDRRVRRTAADELGVLAAGFNRMAEALAEYRRSSLGELISAKMTLEATLDALPDAVLVFDPDGALVTANPPARSVLAASRAGSAVRLAELPFSQEHREAIKLALAGKTSPTRPPDFRHTFDIALGGRHRRFLLRAVPVAEFAEGRFGAVAVLDDVTEFARLDELRSELIGVASHELKSPLTTLSMNLLMLGEGVAGMNPRQQQLVAAAIEGCEELGGTIEELLDVTRIESGQLRLNLVPVDVGALLTTTYRGLETRFGDARVRLALEGQLPVPMVPGDPARLRSVFANVLTNALKYSPFGGTVTVRIAPGPNAGGAVPGYLHVIVTDQGPGVPAEYRERVFEKFFRIEHHLASRAEGVRGTGIGLYLCREIIKAHGGTITCESGDDGVGARIAIALPASSCLS